jgi:A/G-specific adenine glycosylase
VPEPSTRIPPLLLAWADEELRDLPWRHTRDPWAVLVAEIMLQQTQVARVIERWGPFLERWPGPAALAAAGPAAVVRAWAGLGYNRRARNLHRAAEVVVAEHDGIVPDDLPALLALPGVGPYTARAVLAFAFEAPAAPVDTNIGRVLARLAGRRLGGAEAQQMADSLVPAGDAWRWNQGLMELGALVCTKRSPRCSVCPVAPDCRWRGRGADPAQGSAGVSGRQAPFEGSDRQLRGRLVDRLRAGPLERAGVAAAVGTDDPGRAERVVAGLTADGLVEQVEDRIRLAE